MGWIKLDRHIFDSWLWSEDKPFDKRSAWIDLLLLANYEDKKKTYNGKVIKCTRGDVNLSYQFLANRWGWSRGKVVRFLKLLESDGMVLTNSTTHGTTVTLVNYGKYQDLRLTDDTTNGHQTDTTKNIKEKKKKRIYAHPNSFCQIEQQEYDIEQIENELLSN